MTDFPGVLDARFALTTYVGEATSRAYDAAVTTLAKKGILWPGEKPGYVDLDALNAPGSGVFGSGFPTAPDGTANFPGVYSKKFNSVEEWFELIHVLPPAINLGNITSTVQVTIDVFNADRYQAHFLLAFINAAGEGISITNLPSLPASIPLLSGLQLTLQVTTNGPPIIDGDLIFDFDLHDVSIPITGTRIVVFPFQPQAPLVEFLRFNTQVIEKINGTEQRIKKRKNPRQELIFHMRSNGTERAALQNLLFDWQTKVFGLPIWFEPAYLTAAVSVGATVLPVDSTAYADLRVGGLVIVIQDRFTYDAQTIASIAGTSITLASPTAFGYPAGTIVLPMRTAMGAPAIAGGRRPVKVADSEIRFRVIDNDVNLASAAGFSTFKGKVLLDDCNVIRGSLPERFDQRSYQHDGDTGKFSQESIWDRHKRSHEKGFRTRSRKALWEMRGLLHHLGGRLVDFYIPTFYDDLLPTSDLASGSPSLTIENVGYVDFVKNKKVSIRVHLVDGTKIDRDVTSSSEISATIEQLTLNTNWATTIPKGNVSRIEFVELVRFVDDDFEITHRNARGDAELTQPVVEVFA